MENNISKINPLDLIPLRCDHRDWIVKDFELRHSNYNSSYKVSRDGGGLMPFTGVNKALDQRTFVEPEIPFCNQNIKIHWQIFTIKKAMEEAKKKGYKIPTILQLIPFIQKITADEEKLKIKAINESLPKNEKSLIKLDGNLHETIKSLIGKISNNTLWHIKSTLKKDSKPDLITRYLTQFYFNKISDIIKDEENYFILTSDKKEVKGELTKIRGLKYSKKSEDIKVSGVIINMVKYKFEETLLDAGFGGNVLVYKDRED